MYFLIKQNKQKLNTIGCKTPFWDPGAPLWSKCTFYEPDLHGPSPCFPSPISADFSLPAKQVCTWLYASRGWWIDCKWLSSQAAATNHSFCIKAHCAKLKPNQTSLGVLMKCYVLRQYCAFDPWKLLIVWNLLMCSSLCLAYVCIILHLTHPVQKRELLFANTISMQHQMVLSECFWNPFNVSENLGFFFFGLNHHSCGPRLMSITWRNLG